MTHYLRHGTDTEAVCGFPVLAESALPGTAFSTRHDQATCTECKSSPV
jgi:hypothetical protein